MLCIGSGGLLRDSPGDLELAELPIRTLTAGCHCGGVTVPSSRGHAETPPDYRILG